MKAYEGAIHPMSEMEMETDDTSLHMLPPQLKRHPRRPRVNRRRKEDEPTPVSHSKISYTVTCQIYGQLGHNKRICQRTSNDKKVIYFALLNISLMMIIT